VNDEKVYTVEEVAALLRTTPTVVLSALRRGVMPGYKVGREYRITQPHIDAYLANVSKR
jgi:putative molybdopterin biosynthesis protein